MKKENKEQKRNEEKIEKMMRENFLKVWYRKCTDVF